MSNTIQLVTKFVPIMDEIYKRESVTSILDTANSNVQFIGANVVKVFKFASDGLATYNRSSGYVAGNLQATWETLTLAQDRGRSFQLDVMDNEETLGMALGGLTSQFIRTEVAPEVDAYRFAKYAGTSNILAATPADLAASTDVLAAIDDADKAMSDAEVPHEGRILFLSEAAYKLLKNNITRYIQNDEENVNRTIEVLDGMRVIRVPSGRFNTAITLRNGTSSGQTAGGFVPGGYPINFMIIHPSAVVQIVKHVVPRLFAPQQNLDADAWKYDYRIYHDAFVLDNKVAGIYLHRAATANS